MTGVPEVRKEPGSRSTERDSAQLFCASGISVARTLFWQPADCVNTHSGNRRYRVVGRAYPRKKRDCPHASSAALAPRGWFLRSVGLGKDGSVPLSIIADVLALPVDASKPSRLELVIAATGKAERGAGRQIRGRVVEHKLSKYNNLPHRQPNMSAVADGEICSLIRSSATFLSNGR